MSKKEKLPPYEIKILRKQMEEMRNKMIQLGVEKGTPSNSYSLWLIFPFLSNNDSPSPSNMETTRYDNPIFDQESMPQSHDEPILY